MAKIDHKYNQLLGNILDKGFRYEDSNRKNTYRIQIPSYTFEWNFKDGFPALTTKKLWWKGVVGELLFFIQGDMDIRKLWADKIHIWDKDWFNFEGNKHFESIEDAIENQSKITYSRTFSLGRVYGAQWRDWYAGHTSEYDERDKCSYDTRHFVDQFKGLISSLKTNPMSTSNIVTAWNPAEKKNMALPPCHWSFEILSRPLSYKERYALINPEQGAKYWSKDFEITDENGHRFFDEEGIPKHAFTLKWHQRSVDTFLGLPFNIASYALLAQIIGQMTNMLPDGIIGDLSNVHIYEPHMDAVKEQMFRDVDKYKDPWFSFDYDTHMMLKEPSLIAVFDKILGQLNIKDFHLREYESYPAIKAEMLAYDKK